MPSGKSDLHDFKLIHVWDTGLAWIVKETPDGESISLPKSLVEREPTKDSGIYEYTVPEWLALEKELI